MFEVLREGFQSTKTTGKTWDTYARLTKPMSFRNSRFLIPNQSSKHTVLNGIRYDIKLVIFVIMRFNTVLPGQNSFAKARKFTASFKIWVPTNSKSVDLTFYEAIRVIIAPCSKMLQRSFRFSSPCRGGCHCSVFPAKVESPIHFLESIVPIKIPQQILDGSTYRGAQWI